MQYDADTVRRALETLACYRGACARVTTSNRTGRREDFPCYDIICSSSLYIYSVLPGESAYSHAPVSEDQGDSYCFPSKRRSKEAGRGRNSVFIIFINFFKFIFRSETSIVTIL